MPLERKISVIGLGYVGFPVAVAFGKQTKVIGFDINENRILELSERSNAIFDVEIEDLQAADIRFSSDPADLSQADFHIVTLPTPIDSAKQPDLRPLIKASELLGRILKRGDIVV